MQIGTRSLAYGVYFGDSEVSQEVPGFSVSLLEPTLRAEDVPLHTHDNASFIFVISGSYLSSADGATPESSASTLIFNPAGTTHRDNFVLPQGRFLAVSISDQSLRIAMDGACLPTAATAFSDGQGLVTALRFAEQCVSAPVDSRSTMEGLCWELLSHAAGARLWPDESLTTVPSWITRAKELLNDHVVGPLHIAEMARELGIHPASFARAFRRTFRCTPGEYRMRCRLRTAMVLLRNTDLPLSSVALKAGFFDQSHFSTAFRRHFSHAPHAYRKRLQEDVPCAKV